MDTRIAGRLAALEQALIAGEPPAEPLADPARLDVLFRLLLSKLVRAGPGGSPLTPEGLLGAARRAGEAGALPLATAADLRRRLERLAARLVDAGAWDPDRPPWWQPLGAPSPAESLCRRLRDRWDALPPAERLATAFAGPAAPRWLRLPEVLDAELTAELHRELEAAAASLALERAGVGAGERITARRSDSVRYLTGLEGELLASAPAVAALVQGCLDGLGPRLAAALPGRPAFPPGRAMLARYPAPSGGYRPHLDNPGGAHDNGRALTLVLYLNPPEAACAGGEIALWAPGTRVGDGPAAVLGATGGSAVLFDARAVAHRVRPLGAGPARWALTLWLNDAPRRPAALPVPEPTLTDALLPIAAPPLPQGTVLFHELDAPPAGEVVVRAAGAERPRVGIVCTVYRGGERLDAWCAHHVGLGVDHLVLVFDHLEEPAEAADAERLAARWGERLTVWPGSTLAERWAAIPAERLPARGRAELERFARAGSSSYAVAARQTLNAGVALEAARTGELGGEPLDWLLHLDADELLYPEGDGRGGATLERHFSAAAAAGLGQLRYLNHELLQPHRPGSPPRFKINPRLAAARLGAGGFAQLKRYLRMAQTDPRPYFTGYFNGKSAVAVAQAAGAAGVPGWRLAPASTAGARCLAGPSVLHFHFDSPAAFRRKYSAAADAELPPGLALFEPSPVEVATLERIRALRRSGADEATFERELDALHARLTAFNDADVELLKEAGLIFEPEPDRVSSLI